MCLLGKDRTPVGPVWRAACLPPPVALKLRPDALRFQQPARWRRLLLSTEEPSRLPPPGIFRLTQAVLPQEGFPSPSVGSLGFVNKRRFFFFPPRFNLRPVHPPLACPSGYFFKNSAQ